MEWQITWWKITEKALRKTFILSTGWLCNIPKWRVPWRARSTARSRENLWEGTERQASLTEEGGGRNTLCRIKMDCPKALQLPFLWWAFENCNLSTPGTTANTQSTQKVRENIKSFVLLSPLTRLPIGVVSTRLISLVTVRDLPSSKCTLMIFTRRKCVEQPLRSEGNLLDLTPTHLKDHSHCSNCSRGGSLVLWTGQIRHVNLMS